MENNEQTVANEQASWTIRSMDVETRQLAVNCALKRGVSMAEWMKSAVRNQANMEAGDQVVMPGKQRQTMPSNGQTNVDLNELAALLQAVAAAQTNGIRGARTAGSHVLAMVTSQMRSLRGLPPKRLKFASVANMQTVPEIDHA